jgi:signal transduction histidine kinase
MNTKHKHSFKANAHLLKLLGDELIGDDRLAVFELIKNSYDADATKVTVTLDLNAEEPRIIVEDDGSGMSYETISDVWMEVGTPSKRDKNRKRSKIFLRMPLGEKGVGRLAVHKLGTEFRMTTRQSRKKECCLSISWPTLIKNAEKLSDAKVDITVRDKAEIFNVKGTKLEISGLRNKEWKRGDVRRLKKMITSIISPFETKDDFDVVLNVPGKEEWLNDLFDVGDILDFAHWQFSFNINKNAKFSWSYNFDPPHYLKGIKSNFYKKSNQKVELLREGGRRKKGSIDSEPVFLGKKQLEEIGAFSGEFYIYDRRPEIMKQLPQSSQLKNYLEEQTGVRVYRDGVRVYNYGEFDDDWLGLNIRRINDPSRKMGTRNVIAAISLDNDISTGLKEKTNREGFDENTSFLLFRHIVQSIVAFIDRERQADREKLEQIIRGMKPNKELGASFNSTISTIRRKLKKHRNAYKELTPHIDTLENEFVKVRDVMLHSGLSGLNIALIFHEIERELEYLNSAILKNESIEDLKQRSGHLIELLEGFSPLLKRESSGMTHISKIIDRARVNNLGRFEFHKIIFSAPVLVGEEEDIALNAPAHLVLGALHNLIDNSIYWVRRRVENQSTKNKGAILVSNVSEIMGSPSIAVVDNGEGFSISPEEAIHPFLTRKLEGSGLGLYFANLMMETLGGKLIILEPDELELSSAYDGAAVVLQFKEEKK